MSTNPKYIVQNISGDFSGNLTGNNITIVGDDILIPNNINIGNCIKVSNNINVSSNIINTNDIKVSGVQYANTINSTNIIFKETVDNGYVVPSNISLDTLHTNKAIIDNNLTCGNTSTSGSIDLSGNLTVNGNKFVVNNINGNITTQYNVNNNYATNVTGSIDCSGSTILNSCYNVNRIDCSGNMTVSGIITTNNTINTNKVKINSNIIDGGNLDVSGNMTVDGSFNITNLNVNTNKFNVTSTGNTTIGGDVTVNNTVQLNGSNINIGTSDSTVNINGTTNYIQTTNLNINDNIITINKNGIDSSMSGIEIEEMGNITSYIKLSSTRDSFNVKVPTDNTIYNIVVKDPSGNMKINTIDCSGNMNVTGTIDCNNSFGNNILIRNLPNQSTSNVVYYDTSSNSMSYNVAPSTISLSGTNTWTGANQFDSSVNAFNITTFYGQSTGINITSPSVVLPLNDWSTQVNNWSQGYFIVQNNLNKCFYYNFGQFANDLYSNVPPQINGKKFTSSSVTPSNPLMGDEWFNSNTLYKYIDGVWIIVKSFSLYSFTTFTFTNASVSGRFGPTLAQCKSAYSSTSWTQDTNYFNMITQGIQRWTVPATGNYQITVAGAGGGSSSDSYGGRGIIIRTTTNLIQGNIIQILVGQKGGVSISSGGGGGSFVVTSTNSPIIIAGGGAGFLDKAQTTFLSISDATTSTSGNNSYDGTGTGGSGGYGGTGSSNGWGCGGGGLLGNGTDAVNAVSHGYSGLGYAFANGGIGGNTATTAYGGFGAGGGTHGTTGGGGGGGGYSGGGGSNQNINPNSGGGGGSYSISTLTLIGYNNSDGYVTITKL